MPSVTAYCAQHGRLRWNFRVAVIFNAQRQKRAYYVICRSWATNVYIEGFNLQNILNFNTTLSGLEPLKNSSVTDRLRNPGVNH